MMKYLKKIQSLIFIFIMSCTSTIANAQNVNKHIVERGETLESIAKSYNTSKDEIIKLNPDAAQFIYVGMELNLPTSKNTQEEFIEKITYNKEEKNTYKNIENLENYNKWSFTFSIGYGFLKKPEGTKGNCYTYNINIGASYKLMQNFYINGRIGYNSSTYFNYMKTLSSNTNYHFVTIPIEIGYSFLTNNQKIGIIPHAGFDFNICIKGSGKVGVGSNKEKINLKTGGEIGIGTDLGIRLRLWEYNIGIAYVIPLNNKQKEFFGEEAYPEISIGFGF